MATRIVVIEDNQANLELMVYLLRAFGYSVAPAVGGAEGLAAVARERPELIVCDLAMPEIDGYEVGRRLKSQRQYARIPLIAVTALAMVGDREKVLATGFDGYIPKPINPETFVAEVEAFLKPQLRANVTPAPRAAGQEPAAQEPPARRATILVVDDHSVNLQLIRSLLEPFGYHVIFASGPQDAIAEARRSRPDLVLCDLHMPEHGGLEVGEALRADPELQSTPLIVTTSSSTSLPGTDTMAAAARGFRLLVRPIEPQELLEEIEAYLRQARSK